MIVKGSNGARMGAAEKRKGRAMSDIAPWLSVRDATEAVKFYRAAFGAIDSDRLEDEAGDVIVARLSIDGADFWVQHDPGSSPDAINGMSVRMILTVEDPDSVFARAVAAGATEVAPIYEEHGWRIGRIADPSGHHWEIGRRISS
jgi:PhnB protein